MNTLFAAAAAELDTIGLSTPMVVAMVAVAVLVTIKFRSSSGWGTRLLLLTPVLALLTYFLTVAPRPNYPVLPIPTDAEATNRASEDRRLTRFSKLSNRAEVNSVAEAPITDAGSEETVWLPVGKDTIVELFGEEHVDDLSALSEQLSKHSEEAYALIPMSEAQPSPVIRQVLAPTPFRELLTPQNLELLSAALETYASGGETRSEVDPKTEAAESDNVLASWVSERPGLGQAVVRTEQFHESSIPAEEALRPAVEAALKERVTELCSREFSIGRDWEKLIEVSLSDEALRESILRTDRKVSEIETVEGATVMQQTYALIQFPEAAEAKILATVQQQLILSRSFAILLTLGVLWLGAVLLAVASRVSQTGSFLKRWTTGPLIAIAALPCLLAFLLMVVAMAEGHTFQFGPEDYRITCSMDVSR